MKLYDQIWNLGGSFSPENQIALSKTTLELDLFDLEAQPIKKETLPGGTVFVGFWPLIGGYCVGVTYLGEDSNEFFLQMPNGEERWCSRFEDALADAHRVDALIEYLENKEARAEAALAIHPFVKRYGMWFLHVLANHDFLVQI